MRVMKLEGSRICQIILGDSIENLKSHCNAKRVVIITDRNVKRIYGEKLKGNEIIEVGLGEASKTLETVEEIYKKLLDLEVDRSDFIVGVGGGIVCDITGFVASTYLRGLEFGFIPTTLLAQVDASIGGKNGVNLAGYKNLVGVIKQPKFCLCDFETLHTLPIEELRCGFAEVIKHAAIGDAALFSYLETNSEKALNLHRTTIEKVVHDSIVVKMKIVKNDEMEKGERVKLNFGHTIGHAIESSAFLEQKKLSHGEAVAIGMNIEAKISVMKGLLSKDDAKRLEDITRKYGLPTNIDQKNLIGAIRKDKKKFGNQIKLAMLEGIGKCTIRSIGIEELEAALNDLH